MSTRPSPDITKPEGSMGMIDEPSPLIATSMAGTPTGAYTIIDTEESVQLSCSISMLFSEGMKGCLNLIDKKFSKLALIINFQRIMNPELLYYGFQQFLIHQNRRDRTRNYPNNGYAVPWIRPIGNA